MTPTLALLFLASIFIGLGSYFKQRAHHLVTRGKKAVGIIFKNERRHISGAPSYFPVVRFLTERNEWITQETNIGYPIPKPEGEKVEVLYDPLNPSMAEINSKSGLQTLPPIFLAVGAVLLLAAVVVAFTS